MRSAVLILHSFLHLASMTAAPRAEPSFECSRAERPDERSICNDDDLARRDQLAGQIFAMLARKPDTAGAGNEESRKFLDKRRACGSEIGCIRREQNALLTALVQIAAPLPRPVEVKIESTVSPAPGLLLRGLGAILGILLCIAFGWFSRFVMLALWRGRSTRANDDRANQEGAEASDDRSTQEVPEQPLETQSAADKPLEREAASPAAARGWLTGISAWWQRYRTNASAKRAIREIRREKRRPTRFRQGKLFDAYGVFLSPCTICDRSQSGARVRVDKPLPPLKVVQFLDDVEKIIVEAKVVRQRGNELGLAFLTAARSADLSVVRIDARASG
jgi:hypothetical protein